MKSETLRFMRKLICILGIHDDCRHSRVKADGMGELQCMDCGQSIETRYARHAPYFRTPKKICSCCKKVH